MLIASTTWKHLERALNYIKMTEMAAKLIADFQLHTKQGLGVAFGI